MNSCVGCSALALADPYETASVTDQICSQPTNQVVTLPLPTITNGDFACFSNSTAVLIRSGSASGRGGSGHLDGKLQT